MLKKGTQSEDERKAVSLYSTKQTYSEEHWIHTQTVRAEEATGSRGGRIFVTLEVRRIIQHAIPTGTFSVNYRAEADALQTAARVLRDHREATPDC